MLWDVATARTVPGTFAGFETWWNRDEQIEAVLLSRAIGEHIFLPLRLASSDRRGLIF